MKKFQKENQNFHFVYRNYRIITKTQKNPANHLVTSQMIFFHYPQYSENTRVPPPPNAFFFIL